MSTHFFLSCDFSPSYMRCIRLARTRIYIYLEIYGSRHSVPYTQTIELLVRHGRSVFNRTATHTHQSLTHPREEKERAVSYVAIYESCQRDRNFEPTSLPYIIYTCACDPHRDHIIQLMKKENTEQINKRAQGAFIPHTHTHVTIKCRVYVPSNCEREREMCHFSRVNFPHFVHHHED